MCTLRSTTLQEDFSAKSHFIIPSNIVSYYFIGKMTLNTKLKGKLPWLCNANSTTFSVLCLSHWKKSSVKLRNCMGWSNVLFVPVYFGMLTNLERISIIVIQWFLCTWKFNKSKIFSQISQISEMFNILTSQQ